MQILDEIIHEYTVINAASLSHAAAWPEPDWDIATVSEDISGEFEPQTVQEAFKRWGVGKVGWGVCGVLRGRGHESGWAPLGILIVMMVGVSIPRPVMVDDLTP